MATAINKMIIPVSNGQGGYTNEEITFEGSGSEALVLIATLEAGETELIFTNNGIASSSMLNLYCDVDDISDVVSPISSSLSNHTLTYTFDPQENDIVFKLEVK